MNELIRLWGRAVTAELCWLDPSGVPAALAVTPVVAGGVPAVALPYAQAHAVTGLRDTGRAAFAVTDSRSLPRGAVGRAAVGRVELTDDTDGDLFADELLGQELLKYPPSRTLADSPLLRKENWWWLPRVIVRLDLAASRGVVLPGRANPRTQALLIRENGDGPALDVVQVPGTGERLPLCEVAGGSLRGDGAAATVFGYDYSIPDLERWESWSVHGALLGDELVVSGREGDPESDLGSLSLLRRIRRHRELGRACRRGIAAAERLRQNEG